MGNKSSTCRYLFLRRSKNVCFLKGGWPYQKNIYFVVRLGLNSYNIVIIYFAITSYLDFKSVHFRYLAVNFKNFYVVKIIIKMNLNLSTVCSFYFYFTKLEL